MRSGARGARSAARAPSRGPGAAAAAAAAAGPGRAGVPRQAVPCSDSQTCEQMDCFENGKICTQTGSQQHRESSGCQVTEAGRPVRRLRRKRRLPLDSEDEEENAYEDEEKNKSNNMKSRRNTKPIKQVLPGKKKVWNWSSYLEEEQMPAAPQKLFREVQGYRMRLHFDGYPECYDFWCNADSSDIHPVGWCEKTSHKLLPPKGFKDGEFNWTSYLKNCKAQAAPKSLFKTLSSPVTPSGFRLGMKLEAVDKKNPSLVCVATVTDMVENRLLIHFDNWDESYDYWCETSSPYIRPVGYCQETGTPLTTPPGYKDPKGFSWEKYLEETNSQAAPARAFKLRPPHGFQANMKLEAVDRRNPILIRVATIVDKDNHRVKIHFDGWDHHYDFWVDADSPDIHPVGWCDKTGHALQVPLGAEDPEDAVGQACPTPGCQGIGHVRGPRYGTHYTLVGCPYSDVNLSRENLLQDRLSGERPSPGNSMQKARRLETPVPLLGAGESSQGDSSQSRKSASDSEKWCQSSIHTPSEQLENSQEKDWGEENSSADIKATPKTLGCSHAYIKFQLVKQESNGKGPDLDLQQALHQSIFMPSLASNPTHRLHLFWEQHCRLLPEVSGLTAKQVAKWTVEEVVSFIQRLPGCKEQASVFREEQIDGEAFLLLKQNDIVKILSIKLGPALKIYNAILMFKSAEDN
ncbi:lethal(3)malignant brain tumor-like protein 4 isoform X4 [Corvus moneduloides]|uniref:lethal(3)malignant brain tumor-like protein 4 isoform X4 n=1 Tax=Corvus moneduloides TaxID=1196302 RepID=UPI0013631597|nr:lethal(3)malignant brain tumor-like protein 4 isoform X4 [Corvus moneduloides]